ncbi:shikimate kinase [Sediminibacterium soli]|uniref:shikimate kinase n=1 Tax=Sediminibacterium soli TaxID=2698829 RepID=UPI001379646D|nr:shikimate kinase [Sediminibacterium soli]NCI46056.1 shikimate kinase [Sediminibacterium soli]
MKLFLLGMMGTGKTYWAKKLAKKWKTGCYDLDFLIASHEEKSIGELFSEDGEDYFRKSEAKVLRWFAEKKNFVLAVGGGTPFYHENMNWMNKHGVTVWIDEPVPVLFERLKAERAHRPAIKELDDAGLLQFIQAKLLQRMPFYEKAQYHLQGADITDAAFTKIRKEHA